ncbi:MAG: 50S ribosomal protein L25/general stress protein Ctc [Streptosporangiaceae bacterium]
MAEVRIAAETRAEFGKGAARRIRRADKVPAVLYGHGTPARHISLPGHDLMMALKTPNILLRLDGLGRREQLAIPREVQRDPIKGFLKHVDLLVVRRGERVRVEIPIQVNGDVAPGGMLSQEEVVVEVEAEATQIPGEIPVDIDGMEIDGAVHASDLQLPGGVELAADPEQLILHVIRERTAEEVEAEVAEAEAEAGVEREPSEVEAAEAPEAAPPQGEESAGEQESSE